MIMCGPEQKLLPLNYLYTGYSVWQLAIEKAKEENIFTLLMCIMCFNIIDCGVIRTK